MDKYAKSRWFINFLFIICTVRVNGQEPGPSVKTTLGWIEGNLVHVEDPIDNQHYNIREFLGVPYAKPPLGKLRFQKTVPVEAWGCTLMTKTMPKACVQHDSAPMPWGYNGTFMDEDCLYLNIWAPEKSTNLPVLVFIHGGGFLEAAGSANQPIYEGQALAAIGKLIVVVPNFRLGPFGFWYNGQSGDAPGNAGLWDIVEALKWVNKHISKFGGDYKRVTVAGQGAGAMYTTLLTIAPPAKGLYKRQIIQSGSALLNFHGPSVYKKSQALAEELDCTRGRTLQSHPTEIANCMRGITEFNLAKPGPFIPAWENDLLPRYPPAAFLEGAFDHTELLIGITGNEGVPLLTQGSPIWFGHLGERDVYLDRVQTDLMIKGRWFKDPSRYSPAIATYFPNDTLNDYRIDWRLLLSDIVGEYFCDCPTIFYAAMNSKSGAQVYFYEFQFRPSRSPWAKWIGPTHFDEVDFIFGGPFKSASLYPEEELHLSKMMIQHWASFAQTGVPSKGYRSFGKKFTKMVYVGARDPQVTRIQLHQCRFWKDLLYPNEDIVIPKNRPNR